MKMELRRRALDKIYKRRDRIEMPDFQREEVWTDQQKRRLIDTILQGWHLPKFYFRKVDDSSFECVDGQQRLSAILEFFDNGLRLDHDAARLYGGHTYKELSSEYSDAFDDFEIEVEEIEDATDDELEDLFVRLQLGTPLTTAEKLNALGGEARDFARWIARQKFFDKHIGVPNTRYAHFDIATKWLFVEARGIQPQMRFPQLEGFLKDNRTFGVTGEAAKRIKLSLKYLESAFPKGAEMLRNRASVLSVCMLAAEVIKGKIPVSSARGFGSFINTFFSQLTAEVEKGSKSKDTDLLRYQEAISYGSTSGESIRSRVSILKSRLATFNRTFTSLLKGNATTDSSFQQQLSALAHSIGESLYGVNERYSSGAGVDLFKMTNKSTRALKNLGSPSSTSATFANLIDNLYFLVYEGTGDCKRLPTPPPEFAMDIKFLRTDLRHDLDHGGDSEVAKKRKRGAKILRKYTGKPSLGECTHEEFLAGHMRLLEALSKMIEAL